MRNMFLLAIALPLFSFAQTPKDWGAFTQLINVSSYAGKKFRLEAAVKVQLIDSTAEAEIWARVDKKDFKMGFFYNMMDKPIRAKDWKVYSISGKLDPEANFLAFGGLYMRKGIFYFDQFRLFIETSKNKYEEIEVPGGNFESDTIPKPWAFLQKRNGISLSTTRETAFNGNWSCKVDASNFIAQYPYGFNDTLGKYATVNHIKLYYEEYGAGQPLLLLHGNSQSINSFRLQIPEFSKKYRVIAVDTRGQGRSTEDGKTYSYDLFAEDMNAFLNYLHLDSVNILGWSDGGNTGLIMAMKYPSKVKRLVTMGANIFIDTTVVDKEVFIEIDQALKELDRDSTPMALNSARLTRMLIMEPNHKFEELKRIQCHVLVLAGEKDIIKEGHTKMIAASIPHSTLFIAPGQTHYYPWEHASSFNKVVLDYLSQ